MMLNHYFRLLVVTLAFGTLGTAHSIPILLNEADFNTQISGFSVQVEDFESITAGTYTSPFTFSNGTYNSTSNASVNSSSTFCQTGQCLTNQNIIAGVKTFDSFLADTLFWGTDFYNILNGTNPFEVTVVGGSGTATFTGTGSNNGFWGFYDSLGILSVSFENLGSNGGTSFLNYSFDNITTGSATSVPEPTSLALFALGLAGIGFMRKRYE